METNDDKKLDQLIGKYIRLTSLDSPSQGFEERIMQKLRTAKILNKTPYKPLISKFTWSLLVLTFLTLVTYVMVTSEGENYLWLKNINYEPVFVGSFFKSFDQLKFSSITFYSLICFCIVLAIQLPVLKHYFDKQLKY